MKNTVAVTLLLVVGITGYLMTHFTHAATFRYAAETEQSLLKGVVTQVSVGGASGGMALKFGGAPTELMFPVVATKKVIRAYRPYPWCWASTANCHHDYNAADIMSAEGTQVVTAYPGTVVHTTSIAGKNAAVQIMGDDKKLYFYQHMAPGSLQVATGNKVVRGTPIGKVGNRDAAFGTDTHLHFDILPPPHTFRVECSGSACKGYPFINVQPALIAAFQNLPEA